MNPFHKSELKHVKISNDLLDWNTWPRSPYCPIFSTHELFFLLVNCTFGFHSFRRTSVYKSSSRWCRRNAMFPAPLDNKSSKWVSKVHLHTHEKYDHKSHSFFMHDTLLALTQHSVTTSFYLTKCFLTWSRNNNTGKKYMCCSNMSCPVFVLLWKGQFVLLFIVTLWDKYQRPAAR